MVTDTTAMDMDSGDRTVGATHTTDITAHHGA